VRLWKFRVSAFDIKEKQRRGTSGQASLGLGFIFDSSEISEHYEGAWLQFTYRNY
jgi:hypothetical protein